MTLSVIQFLPNTKITKTMAATDSQANDGPPLTELESLQLKANQVTDESLESTRRMIALCEDVSNI